MTEHLRSIEAIKKYMPDLESWEELDRILISPRTRETEKYIDEQIVKENQMQMKWDSSRGGFVVTRGSK